MFLPTAGGSNMVTNKCGFKLDQGNCHLEKLKTISPDTVFCFVSYMYVLLQGSLTTMDVQKGILSTWFF